VRHELERLAGGVLVFLQAPALQGAAARRENGEHRLIFERDVALGAVGHERRGHDGLALRLRRRGHWSRRRGPRRGGGRGSPGRLGRRGPRDSLLGWLRRRIERLIAVQDHERQRDGEQNPFFHENLSIET
jgi:hypothetical protein